MKGGVGRERRGRHGADGEGGVGGTDKGRENRLTRVRYEEEEVKKQKTKSNPKLILKLITKPKEFYYEVKVSGEQSRCRVGGLMLKFGTSSPKPIIRSDVQFTWQ